MKDETKKLIADLQKDKTGWAHIPINPEDTKAIRDLVPGDSVTRYISSARIPMALKVTKVTDTLIECGPWTFDRETGMEEDADLSWGRHYGQTGSWIEPAPWDSAIKKE